MLSTPLFRSIIILSGSLALATASLGQERFWLRVTGDGVYLRSLPDANSMTVHQVHSGDLLEAVEHLPPRGGLPDGWYRILPPEGTFGLAHSDYVVTSDGRAGTVRVASGALRIRFGSTLREIDPMSAEVALLLDDGEPLTIIGKSGDFYRVQPPVGVYHYVNDRFAQRITEAEARAAQEAARVADLPPPAFKPEASASSGDQPTPVPIVRPLESSSEDAGFPPIHSVAGNDDADEDEPAEAEPQRPFPEIRPAASGGGGAPSDVLDTAPDSLRPGMLPPIASTQESDVDVRPMSPVNGAQPDWPVLSPESATPAPRASEPTTVTPAIQQPTMEPAAPAPAPADTAGPAVSEEASSAAPAQPALPAITPARPIQESPALNGPLTEAQGVLRPSRRLAVGQHGLRYGLFDPVSRRATIFVEFPSELTGFDPLGAVEKYVGVRGRLYRDPTTQAPVIRAEAITIVDISPVESRRGGR